MSAPLVVLKFGGTALGNARRIRLAARRLAAWHRRGFRVLAVASATGHTTDRLLTRLTAVGASRRGSRERDRILATGELLAAGLLAHALEELGVPARSLSGPEAGLRARGPWGGGVLDELNPLPLRQLLREGTVAIVAGFQAATPSGDFITLGRGASDLSAVFLAAELGARECHIVTDVRGVHDRDPRLDAAARPLVALSHAALAALTDAGAQVVHPEAARVARDAKLPLLIYRWDASLSGNPGTFVFAPEPRAARLAS